MSSPKRVCLSQDPKETEKVASNLDLVDTKSETYAVDQQNATILSVSSSEFPESDTESPPDIIVDPDPDYNIMHLNEYWPYG